MDSPSAATPVKHLFVTVYRTWSLTLREEHRLRVFENRVLRRIFGLKRDGVTGEWRKLHCTRFWWGNLRESDHWGDQDVGGRIIVRWIFRK